ncbi:MAG TPA: YciI family protein [Chitinophagaceae bacterium]
MKILVFIISMGCLITACDNDDQKTEVSTTTPEKYDFSKDTTVSSGEMKRYWLVLLQKGPDRNQDSISAAKIQAAHMANINRLAKEGKLVMAGPIGIDDDLRGIFLMNCADSSEVENFVKTDSAVITGRLVMKYYPWWTPKGKYIFK